MNEEEIDLDHTIPPTILTINGDSFIFLFEKDKYGSTQWWKGKVAQIIIYSNGRWSFAGNECANHPVEKLEDARIWFEWQFCWRGCWEGRIYFMDDEYWSSEVATIHSLWEKIEKFVKNRIILENPENKYLYEK